MDETQKKQAYVEGLKLMRAGHDKVVIVARLEKQGLPKEIIDDVIANLFIQKKIEKQQAQQPFLNNAYLRIGIGVFLAIVSYILIPGQVYLPVGLILTGVVTALIIKKDQADLNG